MVKILKYDNPDHTIKLKIRQIQVMCKCTGQIKNLMVVRTNHASYTYELSLAELIQVNLTLAASLLPSSLYVKSSND